MQLAFKMVVTEIRFPRGNDLREVVLTPVLPDAGITGPVILLANEELHKTLFIGADVALVLDWVGPGDAQVFLTGVSTNTEQGTVGKQTSLFEDAEKILIGGGMEE